MKRINGLFEKIVDMENLRYAMESAAIGKSNRKSVIDFLDNADEELASIQKDLVGGTYKMGNYQEFYVLDPKRRLIMALPFRDRVVQWAIYRQINHIFDRRYIKDSYACRKGKGVHLAISRLSKWVHNLSNEYNGEVYFLKLDMSKYFYRIDRTILMNLIKRIIKDKKVIALLEYVVSAGSRPFGIKFVNDLPTNERTFDVGIPIGNLTSQMFANLYLNELDQFCKHVLKIKRYIRYMDDIVIIFHKKSTLHAYHDIIKMFLKSQLCMVLNSKSEVSHIKNGISFCGYIVHDAYTKLRHSTMHKMHVRFIVLAKQFYEDHVSQKEIIQSISSYYGLLKHADTYRIRTRLFGTKGKPSYNGASNIMFPIYWGPRLNNLSESELIEFEAEIAMCNKYIQI